MFMTHSFSAMMTVSGTLLSISVLILVTLRFGVSMRVILERLSEWQYDRLYDGMFISIAFGVCALIVGFSAFLAHSECVYYVSFGLFLAQVIFAMFFALIVFWPLKCIMKIHKKNKTPTSWAIIAHSIIDILDLALPEHKEKNHSKKRKK